MGAVIDRASFENIRGYIEHARSSGDATILAGGECDDRVGWFVEPTVVVTTNPRHRLMQEEIFGPVLTIYVYPDAELEEAVAPLRHDLALRAHRRGVRAGPRGGRAAGGGRW